MINESDGNVNQCNKISRRHDFGALAAVLVKCLVANGKES